jgi:hypothetical protein
MRFKRSNVCAYMHYDGIEGPIEESRDGRLTVHAVRRVDRYGIEPSTLNHVHEVGESRGFWDFPLIAQRIPCR